MTQPIVVFKSNLPSLTVLRIFSQDITAVKAKIDQKVKQAPMMFIGMQLIIDLSEFDREECLDLDIKALMTHLQSVGIRPIAVMSGKASLRKEIANTGLGALPVLRSNSAKQASDKVTPNLQIPSVNKEIPAEAPKADTEEPKKTFDSPSRAVENTVPMNLTISQPIRSGQRVYCHGDLTVIGQVSQGAEVIADGNIHIYGKLRGRAIAGAKGDESAMIFCRDFDAELVSIAGNYRQMDDAPKEDVSGAMQILLKNEKICFFPL